MQATTHLTKVQQFMHPGVLTCPRETPLVDVARTMAEERVHCLVVAEGPDVDALWGVVSSGDLAAAALAGDVTGQSAGDAAVSPVVMVTPDETLDRAAQLMLENGTDHLLVVDPERLRPVGVISTLDIAASMSEKMTLEAMSS